MDDLPEGSPHAPTRTTSFDLTRFATADAAIAIVIAVGCFALWSANDAGYEEILWYPVALLFVLLGVVLAWSAPERALGRAGMVALGALAGLSLIHI